ncbi:hypothetical protein ALC62_10019, partial [Cyphomyrmex costatus]
NSGERRRSGSTDVGLVHPEKNPHERWITWVKADRERGVQFVDASPCLNTMPANDITVLP